MSRNSRRWQVYSNVRLPLNLFALLRVCRSRVIDDLLDEGHRGIGVGYFYCEYSQASEAQTPQIILSTFVRQLSLQLPAIPREIGRLYETHQKRESRPNEDELIATIQSISSQFSSVWLLVDALDEYDPQDLDTLIEAFETLMQFTNIFVTSRPQSINSEAILDNALSCALTSKRLHCMTPSSKRR